MTFIELIGFIVTIVAFFLLSIKSSIEKRKRSSMPPEQVEEEEESDLEEALREMGIELKKQPALPKKKVKHPPPPVNAPEEPKKNTRDIFKEHYKTDFHEDAYRHEVERVKGERARKLLKHGSLKDAMILREILGPPKAMHDPRR